MPGFDASKYVTVQDRINQFWIDHPDWSLLTDIVSSEETVKDFVVFRCQVKDDRRAVRATGYAAEWRVTPRDEHDRRVNVVWWVENAETSAIGRALANLGYATNADDRPSREEMEKFDRAGVPTGSGGTTGGYAKTDDPATDKQVYKLLGDVTKLYGVTREAAAALIYANTGKHPSGMTKGEISGYIQDPSLIKLDIESDQPDVDEDEAPF